MTMLLQPSDIEAAAKILREGGTVAFPTETVYGLGANALDPVAVAKIFAAKGRPSWDPLIVHVGDREMLERVAVVTAQAEKLIGAFWPGPRASRRRLRCCARWRCCSKTCCCLERGRRS